MASIKFHSSSLSDSQVICGLSLAHPLLLIHTFQTKQPLTDTHGWVLSDSLTDEQFLNGVVEGCAWEESPSSKLLEVGHGLIHPHEF